MQNYYKNKQQQALCNSSNKKRFQMQMKRTGRKYFEILNSREFSYTIFRFKTLKNLKNM
jgi:hypothetical protein